MKVGKEVALEAKKNNICPEYFSEMTKQSNIAPLCEMYFKGSDWAMENDFPKLNILRKFKGNSEQYGLFTDYVGQLNMQSVLNRKAFFGDSRVRIDAKSFSVSEIYARHNSELTVFASENAIMIINILDDAKITINCSDEADVKVFCYGKIENIAVRDGERVLVKAIKFKK